MEMYWIWVWMLVKNHCLDCGLKDMEKILFSFESVAFCWFKYWLHCMHVKPSLVNGWLLPSFSNYIVCRFVIAESLTSTTQWENAILWNLYSYSPADKCCNNDTPGCTAAVGIGLLLIFLPPATQENGIEEQEKKVQGQTGERHTSQ